LGKTVENVLNSSKIVNNINLEFYTIKNLNCFLTQKDT